MIQANELRIGNWVKVDSGATASDFAAKIDSEGIEFIEEGSKSYSPIILTEKILFSLGFVLETKKTKHMDDEYKRGFGNIYTNDLEDERIFSIELGVKDNACYLVHVGANFMEEYDVYQKSLYPINYLHQLQNLYFALTGEELNYQPWLK